MTDKKKVGFIGAGLMGHGMAKNLVEKGFPLTVLAHRNRQPVEDLLQRGAAEAASPAELARGSDLLFLCVSSSTQVEELILGADGVLAGAHRGLIVVDSTTADPNSTLRLAPRLAEKGARLVDAPLTRTPKEAEAGRLNVLVGADDATMAEIRPALAAFAENIFHVGPLGAGHKIKLLNNFLGLGAAALVAEAVTTAAKVGVDFQALFDIVSKSGGNSRMFELVMPWVLKGDDSGLQFAIRNAAKDLRYYTHLAESAAAAAFVGQAVHQTYALAIANGHGDDYVPRLCSVLARLNGTSAVRPA